MMEDLIKALQIFLKYDDSKYPTACEHDVMYVCVEPDKVSDEDIVYLQVLGFFADRDIGSFKSFRFGSC